MSRFEARAIKAAAGDPWRGTMWFVVDTERPNRHNVGPGNKRGQAKAEAIAARANSYDAASLYEGVVADDGETYETDPISQAIVEVWCEKPSRVAVADGDEDES